ncbi:DUF5959 family protein [Streptomyces sp. NPDC060002]|uniref:DUF5959 family protein n=1 Tax=Streptomyces sp. NPDC060002 TaxID=3347033 RepID=UPI0036AA36D3
MRDRWGDVALQLAALRTNGQPPTPAIISAPRPSRAARARAGSAVGAVGIGWRGARSPFTADWPRSGRAAYLRFIADDPYVVEVHDGPSTQIVVAVPLDLGAEWIATGESRQQLAAARAALGVGTEDHDEVRP